MVNSKAKGDAYERKVAKIITEWSGVKMIRTPLSGGWASGRSDVRGDLVCDDDSVFFPYHIECKNQKGWGWGQTIMGKGIVYDWWRQTIKECPADKVPWLIFHEHGRSDWLMMYLDVLVEPLSGVFVAEHRVMILGLEQYLEFNRYPEKISIPPDRLKALRQI